MKILPYLLVMLALAATGFASAQTPPASPAAALPATEPEPASADPDCARCAARLAAAKEAEMEKAVTDLEQKWCEAEAGHDAAFLEKVEADTFVYTDQYGRVSTKKDEIATAKEGGDKIEFKLSDVKAQIYGDTAVLTGLTNFVGADADTAPSAYRWTDVFVRQANGEWQVVASQATATGQGKIAGPDQAR